MKWFECIFIKVSCDFQSLCMCLSSVWLFPLSLSFTSSLLQIKWDHVSNYKLSSLGYSYIGTVTVPPVSLNTSLMLSVTFAKTVSRTSRMLQRKDSCVLGASVLTQGHDAVPPWNRPVEREFYSLFVFLMEESSFVFICRKFVLCGFVVFYVLCLFTGMFFKSRHLQHTSK